jgi:ribonucleoside-diphosphate reductase beta chain
MKQTHRGFRVIDDRGLDWGHAALKLFSRAKRLGIWNPEDMDFRRDREDFSRLEEPEREGIMHLLALFGAGEESVVSNLVPLLHVAGEEGRLEDELFLAAFLWEEAKHVEAFRRFADGVGIHGDLHEYHGENYRYLFYEALPQSMSRLYNDHSPEAQAEGLVTYNLVIEGVLAETGYRAWYDMLKEHGIMPGMVETVGLIQRDEARHIAFAVYSLSRLAAEHGSPVWEAVQERLGQLLPSAVGVVTEMFERFDARFGRPPFGLAREQFIQYAMSEFQKRVNAVERSLGKPVEQILYPGRTP